MATDSQAVDVAMLEHLRAEVARLEEEKESIRLALHRPVNVTVQSTSQEHLAMLTAVQSVANNLSYINANLSAITTALYAPQRKEEL